MRCHPSFIVFDWRGQYHQLNNYERLSIIAVQAMKGLRRKEDAMKNEAGINKKISALNYAVAEQ